MVAGGGGGAGARRGVARTRRGRRTAPAQGAPWSGAGAGRLGGYTGHDEDIGFAAHGGDVVVGRIPQRHLDDRPAGLPGRMGMAVAERDPARSRACVRVYVVPDGPGRDAGEEPEGGRP